MKCLIFILFLVVLFLCMWSLKKTFAKILDCCMLFIYTWVLILFSTILIPACFPHAFCVFVKLKKSNTKALLTLLRKKGKYNCRNHLVQTAFLHGHTSQYNILLVDGNLCTRIQAPAFSHSVAFFSSFCISVCFFYIFFSKLLPFLFSHFCLHYLQCFHLSVIVK